ncbi:hypothetical protein NV379_02220 [Paenibacillus sp. N1-5-1-14]|uniref:hypothetical protein n=1 Tax=Paenibacillus radicibacter TaxID=2972488 RepID=UPI002159A2A5|nr:hypothetical protein [Paenibacillus radicibacter]MCR8641462.1 hypothetical protein [Paenibacillus radicibacter]
MKETNLSMLEHFEKLRAALGVNPPLVIGEKASKYLDENGYKNSRAGYEKSTDTVYIRDPKRYISLAHEMRHSWQKKHQGKIKIALKEDSNNLKGFKGVFNDMFIYPFTLKELDANWYAIKYGWINVGKWRTVKYIFQTALMRTMYFFITVSLIIYFSREHLLFIFDTFLVELNRMNLHNFFSDPSWQSIGVLFGGVLVFVGAWFGTRLANNAKSKSDLEEQRKTFEAYLELLTTELYNNKKILEDMMRYLYKNPPILNAFDAVLVGANHLSYKTWEQIIASKVTHLLEPKQLLGFNIVNQNIKKLITATSMEVADWRRAYEFHKYYKVNPSKEAMQLIDLQHILDQKTSLLKKEIEKVLEHTQSVCKLIEKSCQDT